MSTAHTPGLLREGISYGAIVADRAAPGAPLGADDIASYGGHLVGESITPSNRRRLVACWNAFDGVHVEAIEDGVFRKTREDRDTLLVDRNLLLLERESLRDALSKALGALERGEANMLDAEWNAILDAGHQALGEVVVPRVVLPAEAAAIGSALDCNSIEQGEPS